MSDKTLKGKQYLRDCHCEAEGLPLISSERLRCPVCGNHYILDYRTQGADTADRRIANLAKMTGRVRI